jgi:hypothetical protein
MNIRSRKENISVQDHLYFSLKDVYGFDPTLDFIRTSKPNLLTQGEMQKINS